MAIKYSVDSVRCDPFRLVQMIGQMQGLLDAVCMCRLIDLGGVDETGLADDLLNKAMSIAKTIMEETKVNVDDQAE